MKTTTKDYIIMGAAFVAMALIAPHAFADTNSNNAAVSGSQNTVTQNNGGIIGSGNHSPHLSAVAAPVTVNNNKAEGGDGGNAHAGAVALGGDGGDGGNGGTATVKDVKTGNQTLNNNIPKQHRNPVHSAPPTFLAAGSSPENCVGSVGGGVGTAVVSLSAAGTKESEACNRRMDARLWADAGHQDIAFARMCMDEDNRAAVEAVGKKCPTKAIKAGEFSPSAGDTSQGESSIAPKASRGVYGR